MRFFKPGLVTLFFFVLFILLFLPMFPETVCGQPVGYLSIGGNNISPGQTCATVYYPLLYVLAFELFGENFFASGVLVYDRNIGQDIYNPFFYAVVGGMLLVFYVISCFLSFTVYLVRNFKKG